MPVPLYWGHSSKPFGPFWQQQERIRYHKELMEMVLNSASQRTLEHSRETRTRSAHRHSHTHDPTDPVRENTLMQLKAPGTDHCPYCPTFLRAVIAVQRSTTDRTLLPGFDNRHSEAQLRRSVVGSARGVASIPGTRRWLWSRHPCLRHRLAKDTRRLTVYHRRHHGLGRS